MTTHIMPHLFQQIWNFWCNRVHLCIYYNGGPFQHVLFTVSKYLFTLLKYLSTFLYSCPCCHLSLTKQLRQYIYMTSSTCL
jgi:hypothetical protein